MGRVQDEGDSSDHEEAPKDYTELRPMLNLLPVTRIILETDVGVDARRIGRYLKAISERQAKRFREAH